MPIKGQDWASYQSGTPSTAGLDFVFIKATEGTSYANPRMSAQAAHARAAGLVVGFYHFLHAGSIAAQAAYFVDKAASLEGDPLFVDWETAPGGGYASCAEKDAFIKEVQRLRGASHRVGLYCNLDFWKNRDTTSFAGDALWIADYVTATKPRITAKWLFHQYTSTPVDTNVAAFASRAALKAWATKAPAKPSTPAKPKPKPTVDLSNLVAAAKADPRAKQGHATHAADVKIVEAALKAEGLLAPKYASDGSFGTTTVTAYAAWQRKCGYKGADANGIPGSASLKKLGTKRGFTVKG